MATNNEPFKLSDYEQVEFIKLADIRMKQIKESIPQIDTADEAKAFFIGATGTLTFLAEKLLSPDVYNDLEEYINSETKTINEMIDRLRGLE